MVNLLHRRADFIWFVSAQVNTGKRRGWRAGAGGQIQIGVETTSATQMI